MSSREIELSEAGDELIVRFAYHPALVDVVRGLSRRRWDRESKNWWCPVEIVVEVVERLVDHGFVVSAAVRGLYVQRGGKALGDGGAEPVAARDRELFGDAAGAANGPTAPLDGDAANGSADVRAPAGAVASAPRDAATAAAPATLTVSELNARVHRVLSRSFPEMLWVVGEIAGFDRNRHRAHVHFQLMEKAADEAAPAAGAAPTAGAEPAPAARNPFAAGTGGPRGAIKASVEAVLFARARAQLERKLAASDAPFELKDGLEVRVGVRVDLFEPKGAYQLIVEDIDPVHTLGRIAQNRAAVLAELEKRGLRERNAALPWPDVPLRVGLITSLGSDAYNDFVNELARSGYAFEITVADARMQGAGLERGLVAAIAWFCERAQRFDALAIVRGGGARTDLLWFDNLQVALAVATCPIKVVSGIGHQRDVSVIDLIAHPEKTPTAAAAALVGRVREFDQRLEDALARLADQVGARVAAERERLLRCTRELLIGARGTARLERERLRTVLARLRPAAGERLRAARRALADARVRLVALGRAQARLQRSALAALRRRLDPAALEHHLGRRGAKLAGLEQLAQSLHPRAVLRRGFAIVRDAAGRTLRDAAAVAPPAAITATLASGRLHARVERAEVESSPAPARPPPAPSDPPPSAGRG